MTSVCRLLWSIESIETIEKKLELSANTVAFITCRSRPMLADATRKEWLKRSGVGEAE